MLQCNDCNRQFLAKIDRQDIQRPSLRIVVHERSWKGRYVLSAYEHLQAQQHRIGGEARRRSRKSFGPKSVGAEIPDCCFGWRQYPALLDQFLELNRATTRQRMRSPDDCDNGLLKQDISGQVIVADLPSHSPDHQIDFAVSQFLEFHVCSIGFEHMNLDARVLLGNAADHLRKKSPGQKGFGAADPDLASARLQQEFDFAGALLDRVERLQSMLQHGFAVRCQGNAMWTAVKEADLER